jgi:hypothetical protein
VNSVPQREQARRREGGGLACWSVIQQAYAQSNRQLNHQGRDLVPTTDLRAVMKA